MNSLDMLQDCLQQIYSYRKKSLAGKSKRSARLISRRKIQTQRHLRPKTPIGENITDIYEEDVDDEEDGIRNGLEDLAETIQSEINNKIIDRNSRIKHQLKDNLPRGMPKPEKPQPSAALYGVKDSSTVSMTASSSSSPALGQPPSSSSSLTSFVSVQSQKHDLAAAAVFEEFRTEFAEWWTKNGLIRKFQDNRAEYADFLSDKYLAKKLDPLPPSRVVTQMRKEVASVIERFASADELGADFPEEAFRIAPPGTFLTPAAAAGGNSAMSSSYSNTSFSAGPSSGSSKVLQVAGGQCLSSLLTSPSSSSSISKADKHVEGVGVGAVAGGKSVKSVPTHELIGREKGEREKVKIKEQYEVYMKLKKQSENHAESEKTQQMEEHLDDIRSLLTSITSVTTSTPSVISSKK